MLGSHDEAILLSVLFNLYCQVSILVRTVTPTLVTIRVLSQLTIISVGEVFLTVIVRGMVLVIVLPLP